MLEYFIKRDFFCRLSIIFTNEEDFFGGNQKLIFLILYFLPEFFIHQTVDFQIIQLGIANKYLNFTYWGWWIFGFSQKVEGMSWH